MHSVHEMLITLIPPTTQPRYDDGYWDDGAEGYYDEPPYADGDRGGYDEAMVTGVSPTGQMEPIGEEILVGGVLLGGCACV